MQPTFEQKIAAYRVLKAAGYRSNPYWKMARFMVAGDLPPESTLWQWLWSVGVKVPPQEFLSAPALFSILFVFTMLFCAVVLIPILVAFVFEPPTSAAHLPSAGATVGIVVIISMTVATIETLGAFNEKRKFGFDKWETFEPFDAPYGPTLREVLASQQSESSSADIGTT